MSRVASSLIARVCGVCAVAAVATGTAAAHGTSLSEFQAPLPLHYLLAGAGATVGVTAVLLVRVGRVPENRVSLAELSERTADRFRTIGRVAFLLLVVAALVHGLVGRQTPADNLATVFVWPVWVMGLAIVAVVAGSPWRVLSPWRTVYEGLCRLEGDDLGSRRLPDRVGVWPALLGFVLLVGLAENLTSVVRSPGATAGLVAAYGLVVLAGSLVYGRAWFRRADPLEVFYGLLGRTAPFAVERRDSGGRALVLRAPWLATARPVATRTHAALVIAAVFTVSFDGFVETRAFQEALFGVRSVVPTGAVTPVVLYLIGLLAFLATFAGVARLTGAGGRLDSPATTVAATVVPIAAAYQVAHTYPFVLANLGRLPAVLGGNAFDLVGWLSVPAFWGSQVVLIVAGHLVAVVAAHLAIDRRVADTRRPWLAHAPLVVLMVGYTVLSLWIISRPVVG